MQHHFENIQINYYFMRLVVVGQWETEKKKSKAWNSEKLKAKMRESIESLKQNYIRLF